MPTNNEPKTIVLTGANGQLGQAFRQLWPQSEISQRHDLLCCDIDDLNIVDRQSITEFLASKNISAIVNCAGYTAVDAAESNKDIAYKVNEEGPKNLAAWCLSHNAGLLHVSTDFVFSGEKTSPYLPEDKPAPLGVYGASKLAGEQAVMKALPNTGLIVRTSWLYSPFMANFVKTMLRLMAEKDELKVVSDQLGSPTSCFTLASVMLSMLAKDNSKGIYHWSDGGEISWYDFAVAIQEEALYANLLSREIPIRAITTEQFPTAARRPPFSVLDVTHTQRDFECPRQDWREQLRRVIGLLALEGQDGK